MIRRAVRFVVPLFRVAMILLSHTHGDRSREKRHRAIFFPGREIAPYETQCFTGSSRRRRGEISRSFSAETGLKADEKDGDPDEDGQAEDGGNELADRPVEEPLRRRPPILRLEGHRPPRTPAGCRELGTANRH